VNCGIAGYGVYLPLYRVKSSDVAKAWGGDLKSPYEKTVPSYDEDSITMGIEAGLNALKNSRFDGEEIDLVYFATTSSPYIEKQCSSTLAFALGCKSSVRTSDFDGSPRVCSSAMLSAFDALRSSTARNAMVVASDKLVARPGESMEQLLSAGAAAFVLTNDEKRMIARIDGFASYSTEFTDRWHSETEVFPRSGIERFGRDYGYTKHVTAVIKKLLESRKSTPKDYSQVVFTEFDPRRPSGIAKSAGYKDEQISRGLLTQFVGDTGAASMFLSLSAALEKAKPGERIMAVSYGDGGSDALEFGVTEVVREKQSGEVEKYLKSKQVVDYQMHLRLNKVFEMLR
jgi:hydroxymethylglutaryl-CoA synthase